MIETRTAFARRIGVHKSQITRAAQAGRLVLMPDGHVNVEASIERWHATKGGRDDVAARWAQIRGKRIPLPTTDAGLRIALSRWETCRAKRVKAAYELHLYLAAVLNRKMQRAATKALRAAELRTYKSEYQKQKSVSALSESYVCSLLFRTRAQRPPEIPKELINLKREEVKTARVVKEFETTIKEIQHAHE